MNMMRKSSLAAAGKICLLIAIVLFRTIANASNGSSDDDASEYYSSIAGLETLLKTEQILLGDLKDYVAMTKQSINIFEKEINKIEQEQELAVVDTDNYLTNPVNAYKLITRLYNDWPIYKKHIEKGEDFLQLLGLRASQLNFPSQDDFEESALALVRLQNTYNLDVTQLSSGILNGIKYGNDMTWSDCLFLGQQLINVGAYNHTRKWVQESARRFHFDAITANESSLAVMEILGENLLKIGDIGTALQVFQTILNNEPKRLNVLADIYDNTYILPNSYPGEWGYHSSNEFKLYEKVCREDVTRSPSEERHLRCHYYHDSKCDFCRLAPFKVEELSIDPEVMMLHDMISEEAIETLKELALPIMTRSTVRTTEGRRKRNYRISKNAWLPYETHPYAMKMLRDLRDVTGLDMSHSEQLQVANYGLGGHYEPHFDFLLNARVGEESNRLATSIYYLSDVEQGGATAFPFLKFAVKPTKGSVLFWYNLHRSLDGDFRTKHAGCPVLKGSKWIANVWTHDRSQDVSRPCHLHRDHESSLEYATVT